jgi:hypothetical protein
VLFSIAPVVPEKVPEGHSTHTVAPVSDDQAPALHSRHCVDALLSEYWPGGHATQTEAMDNENVPAEQFRHVEAAVVGA